MVYAGCNFNACVDEDDNTGLMVFLLVNDPANFNYVSKKIDVDYSKKSKYGESMT